MKIAAVAILCFFSTICMNGCETVKGTVSGAATGMSKDAKNTKEAFTGKVDENGVKQQGSIQKADSWIQKNLW